MPPCASFICGLFLPCHVIESMETKEPKEIVDLENEIVTQAAALSLCRNVLIKNYYCISLFIGTCPEQRETEWAIQQIDRILDREGYFKS